MTATWGAGMMPTRMRTSVFALSLVGCACKPPASGARELGLEPHPHPLVFGVVLDPSRDDCVAQEGDAVVEHGDLADIERDALVSGEVAEPGAHGGAPVASAPARHASDST